VTFTELARTAEKQSVDGAAVVYPQGHSAEFVFAVLRGWRDNVVVCPLEPDQAPPPVRVPPAPCCHLKTTQLQPASRARSRSARNSWPRMQRTSWQRWAAAGLAEPGVISLAHSYGFSNLVLPLLLHAYR